MIKAQKVPKSYDFGTNGTPDWTLTSDLLLRRQSLYTTELRGHTVKTVIFTRHSIPQKGRSVKRISSIGANPSEIPVKNHRADAGVFLHSPDFFLYLLYHKNGDLSMTFAEI